MKVTTSAPRQFSLYAAGSIISNAVNLLLLPFISRQVSAGGYGVFSLSVILFAFLGLVLDGGLVQALIKFHGQSQDTGDKKTVFMTIAAVVFLIASLLAFGVLASARPVAHLLYGDRGLAPCIRLTVVAAWSALLFQLVLAWLRSALLPVRHLALSSLRAFLFLIAAVMLLKLRDNKLQALFISWTFPYLGLALMCLPYALLKNRSVPKFRRLPAYFRYCLPLVPAGVIMWILGNTDLYLLRRLASLDQVGIYTLGAQVCYLLSPVIVAIQLGWLPLVFSVSRDARSPRLFARLFDYLLLVLLLLGMATAFFSAEIVRLLATPGFYRAGYVVPPLTLSAILYAVFLVFSTGINVRGRTLALPFITLGAALVNIVLDIVMIPRWGIYGAAYATVAANLVLVTATGWRSHSLYPIPFISRRSLTVVFGCAVAYNIYLLLDIPWAPVMAAAKLALLGSVPLFLLLTGFFKWSELDEIKKKLQEFKNG